MKSNLSDDVISQYVCNLNIYTILSVRHGWGLEKDRLDVDKTWIIGN